MAKPIVDWTFVRNGGQEIYCARCGESLRVGLPQRIPILIAAWEAFTKEHAHCKEKPEEATP